MTSAADAPRNPRPFDQLQPHRGVGHRALRWMRANLFSSISSSLITLLLIALLARMLTSLAQWGIRDAVWTVPGSNSSACRAVHGLGACWAVIPEKYRFILFGTYPFDQQWRPALAVGAILA